MKRFFALLLALAMVLSLAACGNDAEPVETFLLLEVTDNPFETTGAIAAEETDDEFSAGSSVDHTYKSAFIGIQCFLDLDWTFMSDAEISAENLPNATVRYDMMANHSNNLDSVSVVLEKLSAADRAITAEEYLTAAKDPTVEALSAVEITVNSAEIVKIRFAGEEHTALAIAGNYVGYPIYEYLVAIKCGSYMACVTVCTWDTNTCMDILNQFQPY